MWPFKKKPQVILYDLRANIRLITPYRRGDSLLGKSNGELLKLNLDHTVSGCYNYFIKWEWA